MTGSTRPAARKYNLDTSMLRAFGTFGLGIVFVAISPALRGSLMDDADQLQRTIVNNSPWSYIGIGLGILTLLMFGLHRSSQPRV